MKRVVMIGNCHMTGIRKILEFTDFPTKYTVEQYANWEMIERREAPPIQSIASADVVIYQPLSDVHGCYSSKSMLQFCRTGAKTISIPRIHNNALWPIYAKRGERDIYYGGDYIEACRGKSKNEIMTLYNSGLIDFKFQERFGRNIQMSIDRERDTDVKVVPFILDNIKRRQLFLTHDHPTTCIFQHVVEQLLEPLGISFVAQVPDNDNLVGLEDHTYHIPSHRFPQSSFATKELGFTWVTETDDEFYRQSLLEHLNHLKI